MLRAERQSALKSKITNDGLTRSGTGCFIAVVYPYNNTGRQRVKLRLTLSTEIRFKLCYVTSTQ